MVWKCMVFKRWKSKMMSSYFKRMFLFFQICLIMYHEFYADQNFLGTERHCFSWRGRWHSTMSTTSYKWLVSKWKMVLGKNLHFQSFHVPMKRVDWNKYFSLLIMITLLKAVAKNYVNRRENILIIIFWNFYCWVTWDNTKINTSNALNS